MAIYIDLIQRGSILRVRDDNETVSRAIRMDYMGNARFEFGVASDSLLAMQKNAGNLRFVVFTNIGCEDGRELIAYGDFRGEKLKEYAAALKAVVSGKHRCEERTGLPEAMARSKNLPAYVSYDGNQTDLNEYLARCTNFWWDLENHVLLSFDTVLMERLPKLLQNSWRCMNEGDEPAPVSPPAPTLSLHAEYHGQVVGKLRDRAGAVHSLLVDIGGGLKGRLPIDRLIGDTEEEQSYRKLFDGDWVKVRVERINKGRERFVLSEREINARRYPNLEEFLDMIEFEDCETASTSA
jgi:hypothetical protein